jgi:hypothetical protein
MPRNSVQSVGNSTYTFTHPLVNGGQPVNIVGIKLDAEYLSAKQQVDTSKVTLLVDGSAITLTNVARAGMVTISAADTGGTVADGNMVAIARELQQIGDSLGGQLRVATTINGIVNAITLLFMTLKTFDLIKLAGNDIPTYPVEWNYQDWTFS